MEKNKKRNKLSLKKFTKGWGPGIITGASDDDPSGIATYSQTGAQFGFGLAWTALFSLPFISAIQEMCGRIGLVTGKGLSGIIKKHYNKTILYTMVSLLLVANVVTIGADLGAMAAAIRLIYDIPFVVLLLVITAFTLVMEIFVPYAKYAKFLKYLTLSLLSYVLAAFVIGLDWSEVLSATLIPYFEFSEKYLLNLVAILGTTISPYLFFWQSDEEVEEAVAHKKLRFFGRGIPKIDIRDIRDMRRDVFIGMFFSIAVMFFIIVVAAATLNAQGITNIETAEQAALALRPIAGDSAFLLFTAGIVGTGLLAIPVLAGSASYAISEALNWKAGLNEKLNKAKGFYGIITLATLAGLVINFTPIPAFKMLYYAAVLNGICAPPLIFMILLIANNEKVMGKRTNSKVSNILGVTILILMSAAAIGLLVTLL